MNTTIIRDVKMEDAKRLLEIYAYYVKNTAITFEYEIPTLEEFQNRINNTQKRYPYIVIEKEGQIDEENYRETPKQPANGIFCKSVIIPACKETDESGFLGGKTFEYTNFGN